MQNKIDQPTPPNIEEVHRPDKRYSLLNPGLFCLVLLVEVFGLSVALGGPWIEVSYFLLVVISQTIAGAYIWAHLRKDELRLPIPELLAMGFAIGSSTAAISQLVLRDLLGVRLMISPYVPIIAVAIWLIFKRSPRLAVEITHTDSTTLLWLLFPAPLAMSYFAVELLPIFVVPLALFAWMTKSERLKESSERLISRKFNIGVISFLLFLTFVTTLTSALLRTYPTALTLIGNDELFDFAHSRGFARWGINENINVVGETFSYYKLSHLWLGPIIDLMSQRSILITTSVLPVFLYLIISIGLWALTKRISSSQQAANIAAVLIFAQSALPEPYMIERRPLYLLGTMMLVTILIAIFIYSDSARGYGCIVFLSVFTLASIRLQYGAVLFFGLILYEFKVTVQGKCTNVRLARIILVILLGFALSYFVFFRSGASQASYLTRPDLLQSFRATIEALMLRVLVPVSIFFFLKSRKSSQLAGFISISALIFLFFIPSYAGGRYPIEIILLVSIPICATVVASIIEQNWQKPTYYICLASFAVGATSRFLYDIFKWTDPESLAGIQELIYRLTTDNNFIQVFTLIPLAALSILAFKLGIVGSNHSKRPLAVGFCVFSFTFGVFISTDFRTVTTNFRYGTEIFNTKDNGSIRWLVEDDFKLVVEFLSRDTTREDVIATNVNKYDDDYEQFGSTLILTSITGRRFFLEAPFFDRKTPLFFMDTFNARIRTSLEFPKAPSSDLLPILINAGVKWFVVDLERTELRDWEPWATTRFINDKVAILELATEVKS